MKDRDRTGASPSAPDGDGVRITEYGRGRARAPLLYKALALVLIGCSAGFLAKMALDRAGGADGTGSADTAADAGAHVRDTGGGASGAVDMRDRDMKAQPAAQRRDPDDLANYVAPGQPPPTAAEVIERLHKAGIHTGLGAFSPPGTSPPLIGLAVPDDYVLPEGYVRHFQATDDGQRIEAILMYSPDFDFYDSAGRRIAIPENRVVPAHLAPPGLAIRLIEIPPPLDARDARTQGPKT